MVAPFFWEVWGLGAADCETTLRGAVEAVWPDEKLLPHPQPMLIFSCLTSSVGNTIAQVVLEVKF